MSFSLRSAAVFAGLLVATAASAASPLRDAQVVRNPDGTVRIAVATLPGPALGATPETAARAFVTQAFSDLGLRSGATLSLVDVHRSVLGASVRFEQRYNNLPVWGGDLVVTLSPDNRLRMVSNGLHPFTRTSVTRNLDVTAALTAAAQGIDGVLVQDGRPAGATRDVLYVRGATARLAYEVRLAHFDPLKSLYALVDAETGERLSLHDRTVHSSNSAFVWEPSPGRNCDAPLTSVQVPDLAPGAADGGYLIGNKLVTSNCCYHNNCDPTQPPKRVQGTISAGQFTVQYDTVVCDRAQTATNSQNCRTDYVYPWEPEPATTNKPGTDPADEDPFAEVQGYVEARKAYTWFNGIDPTFDLRDNKKSPPQQPLIWVNLLFPDITSAISRCIANLQQACKIDNFMRVDNSAYIPVETWAAFNGILGSQTPQTDALTLFQGPEADFSYDDSVVYHEFTHGVIFSSANFNTAVSKFDQYGAMNEAGTMHEGYADYFSSAMRHDPLVGAFVGPRIQGAAGLLPGDVGLRDLTRSDVTPDSIQGEVHQDSQFFSESIWQAREQFLGADNGATFDTAIYQGLVALSSSAGFSEAITSMALHVVTAFPSISGAQATFIAPFLAHGVIQNTNGTFSLSRIETYWNPIPMFNLVGADPVNGPAPEAAGPVQFQVWAPQGATKIAIQFTAGFSLTSLTGGSTQADALVSINQPITFNITNPVAITDDAQFRATFQGSGAFGTGTYTATFAELADGGSPTDGGPTPITVACGGAWINLALVTPGGGVSATNLTATVTADPTCTPADGGPSYDAGSTDASVPPPAILCRTRDAGIALEACPPGPDAGPAVDAGTVSGADAGSPKPPGGCGCGTPAAGQFATLLLLALGFGLKPRRSSRA